jgi:hypothetical protein
MINAAIEAMDLVVSCFTGFASCTTLFMCLPLPLPNRPTSHGACPRCRYTVSAKVGVFKKRENVQLKIRAETVTGEITMPMVLPPPPSIDQKI